MLETSTGKVVKDFELNWRIGARTALLIVQLANRYESEILVSHGEMTVSGKSLMGLLMLQSEEDSRRLRMELWREPEMTPSYRDSGLPAGSRIRVTANGRDAAETMMAITELFSCGNRVDHCPQADCSSPPILISFTQETIEYACSNGHDWEVGRADETLLN